MTSSPGAGRWWREPLVQFLALGALLFAAFEWLGGGASGSLRIVITPGQIDAIVAAFTRTWQRPPTEQELKGQLDEYVREEIATREAMALGLDRDDTIVRRRLRQKLEFLHEDTIDATVPTDAELQAWLDEHPETFRIEPEVAFRQVHLSPDPRGASMDGDARRLLDQLSKAPPHVAIESFGDAVMLPQEVARSTRTDVASQFGEEFADAIVKVEPGGWAGPIRSTYGLHVVFVREREEGRLPTLAEVRPQVERELTADRRRRQLAAMYDRLLARYRVVVEERTDRPAASSATTPEARGGAK
jgi:hypothetical protein